MLAFPDQMSVSVGIKFAAHDLIFLTHDKTEGPVHSTGWVPRSHNTRKTIYNLLIKKTWGKTFSDPEETGNHIKKASRWDLAQENFEKMSERWVCRDMIAPPPSY